MGTEKTIKTCTTTFITDSNGDAIKFETLGTVYVSTNSMNTNNLKSIVDSAVSMYGNDVDAVIDVKVKITWISSSGYHEGNCTVTGTAIKYIR